LSTENAEPLQRQNFDRRSGNWSHAGQTMGAPLKQLASFSTGGKLAFAALGILVIFIAFRLLETSLPRHFQQADVRYRVRKVVVFLGYVVGLLFLVTLFEDRLGRFTFVLGVAGAGIVVALQDVFASAAGWFVIGGSRLYAVGDRVQIGDTTGDVIDISILRYHAGGRELGE